MKEFVRGVGLVCAAVIVLGLVSGASAQTVRINCGGKASGVWAKDRSYSTGTVIRTTGAVARVKYAPLAVYQSCRTASYLAYSFPGQTDGFYRVRLHFAELVYSSAGSRVFNISMEGLSAFKNVDVFALTGGKNRAMRLSFLVAVKDGNGLQLSLKRKAGGFPILNGLEIEPLPVPADLTLVPGGVNWGPNPLGSGEVYTLSYSSMYAHSVSSFYLSGTEVTKAKWDEVRTWALTNGYTDLPAGDGVGALHPVQQVNWFDCVKWCNARSQKEGRIPAYYGDTGHVAVLKTGTAFTVPSNCVIWRAGYRLPSQDEWAYAARGARIGKRFPWGDTIAHSNANYFSVDQFEYDVSGTRGYHPLTSTNAGGICTAPVGSFPTNAFGLFDMAGNVSEWVWNWHPNGIGSQRMALGGDYDSNATYSRVANLPYVTPDSRFPNIGFRPVLPLGP